MARQNSKKKNGKNDAFEMLIEQHREVDELFESIEDEEDEAEKLRLFQDLADKLAIHTSIEEQHFYPAVRERQTEDLLHEALEEHLSAKRLIADLLELEPSDDAFDAKLSVLKEQIEHHVEEEENELFPKVAKIFSAEELDVIAQQMASLADELEQQAQAPRFAIPQQTTAAPTLQ